MYQKLFPNVLKCFASEGVDVFKAAAQSLHSQFLLGFTTGDVAKREYVSQVQLALL